MIDPISHVLLIHLGPVQEFIASARRCRDLWFGSWVLSELGKAAAAGIVEAIGGGEDALRALVFPAPADRAALTEGSPISVANKLVVRVPGDGARVREVAKQGHARMRARLGALREEAFRHIGNGDPQRERHFFIERARQQVDELFEYLWVAVPEPEGEDGYEIARREADRLLAARKNTQTWKQPTWALDGIPKSSLDGVRESVLHEDIYGPPRAAALASKERRKRYGVHGAERLCGVGLLKRWGVALDGEGATRIERFFSTAHLAALPLMLGIDGDARRAPKLPDAWRELCDAAGPAKEELNVVPGRRTGFFGNIDGAILFRQRLSETLADCGQSPDSDITRAALAKLKAFLKLAGRAEPLPYYAILVADGDDMGQLISRKKTHVDHRDFSKALDRFAQSARGIVAKHDGCLIYSGGDDVLAFLPLHRAIECARDLAKRFAELPDATLSAGLAIVHYVDAMGAALKIARDAEKRAKEYPDKAHPQKNALAVALDKRSGGTLVVCGHWDALAPRLLHLAALHDAEAIPDKAGHELAELERLGEGLDAIRRSEALRILRRKRAQRGKEDIADKTRQWLEEHLTNNPAELGAEIEIAALIAKAQAEAAPRYEEGA